MSDQLHHQWYRILDTMDLAENVRVAFSNSVYHLGRVEELLKSRGMQTADLADPSLDEPTRRQLQADVNLFHVYLRGFLWELVATFDTLLQWANERYELGISEDAVKWTVVKKKTNAVKHQAEWNKNYLLLESAWESDWYFEARSYRNFAHRGFGIVMTATRATSDGAVLALAFLLPVRQGQKEFVAIAAQLRSYLESMAELCRAISPV